jgi:hypothetical protein
VAAGMVRDRPSATVSLTTTFLRFENKRVAGKSKLDKFVEWWNTTEQTSSNR